MNKTPSLDDLRCLIGWPDGTVGYAEERALLSVLLSLCEQYGYGRVPQMAAWIEEIWRDPSKMAEFERRKQEHLAFMAKCRAALSESASTLIEP